MEISDDMTIEEIIDGLNTEYGEEFNWTMIPFSQSTDYFLNELKNELGSDNELFTNNVYAVAKCDSNDDVLYLTGNSTKEIWRIYHLTYSEKNDAGYPIYKEFTSRKDAANYIQGQFIAKYL